MSNDVAHFGRKVLRLFRDPQAFGRWFAGSSWDCWFAVLHGVFGLEPSDQAIADILLRVSGRPTLPSQACHLACFVAGRGAGKSLISAFLACCYALRDYTPHLAPGERATIVLLAADRRQARVLMRYVLGFFRAIDMLGALIERETAEGIDLTNRVTIEIHTASFRALRGYRVVCAICDEIAFWSVDGANPDREILSALGPALARTPGALLVLISSPFARKGELHRYTQLAFGKDHRDVFVVNMDTLTANPSFDRGAIDRAFADDAVAAFSEYGQDGRVEFRSDLEQLVSMEIVERNVVPGRGDLPPVATNRHEAFFDGSGGTTRGGDSATLAIGHRERDHLVVDLVREYRPPYDPEAVVAEMAKDCRRYRVRRIFGDRFAGSWPQACWRKQGIDYTESALTKSSLYGEMMPILSAGRLELPDLDVLKKQLIGLERRVSSGGRTLIDHSSHKGAHDDVVNVVAGLAYVLGDHTQRSTVATIGANERFEDIEADPDRGLRVAQDTDPRFGSWWGNRTFGIHRPHDTPYGASLRARMRAARARRELQHDNPAQEQK